MVDGPYGKLSLNLGYVVLPPTHPPTHPCMCVQQQLIHPPTHLSNDNSFKPPSLPLSTHRDYSKLVLVAGGIGLTPMTSTLSYIAHQKKEGKLALLESVTLVWAVRNEVRDCHPPTHPPTHPPAHPPTPSRR